MRTRKLGWTSLNFTTVGLGTWAQGGGNWKAGWGDQDDQDSIAAIHEAISTGISWIDTAAVYGLGHAEEVLGRALKDIPNNERPYIATKCGRIQDDSGNIMGDLRAASLKKEVDLSLSRLGIDVIDLYQIHWPDPEEYIEEAWDTLAGFVKDGKVRYIGVSNFNVQQMKRIKDIHQIASLQPPYSMFRREVEEEILPYCGENNIGVIAYSPMQKGLLTGKFTKERAENLPANDHRSRDPMFQPPQIDTNLRIIEELTKIAEQNGRTMAQLAVAWVLRRPELTGAIAGARRQGQITETVKAHDWDLSSEDIARIDELLKERE